MSHNFITPRLRQYIKERITEFDRIEVPRKQALEKAADFVQSRLNEKRPAKLVFICTHNSRRSHIAQIWAQTAAYLYDVENVQSYSGGTEATAFNPNAINALIEAGMEIKEVKGGPNPLYEVLYAQNAKPVKAFSKIYDQAGNPSADFAAIMTCSHADENCPFIPGALLRAPIAYDDPKEFDDTPQQDEAYRDRTKQIAREMLYLFSKVEFSPQTKPASV